MLGQGAFGESWAVLDAKSGSILAMKTEQRKLKKVKYLKFEYCVLLRVQISPWFARVGVFGKTSDLRFLCMECLGPSLSRLRKKRDTGKFSFSTGVRIAHHSLKCIEAFHDLGFIHRDIKPSNILTREGYEYPLCLIDLGLAKPYIGNTGKHLRRRVRPGFRGTRTYSSQNADLHCDLSRRDDMISWFYASYDLLIERLPWDSCSDEQEILGMKQSFNITANTLQSAPELGIIWNQISKLEYAERPKYDVIFSLLLRLCERNGVKLTDPYDWDDILKDYRREIAVSFESLYNRQIEVKARKMRRNIVSEQLLGPGMAMEAPSSMEWDEPAKCGCCG
jgi:serine/threonine protein kinase